MNMNGGVMLSSSHLSAVVARQETYTNGVQRSAHPLATAKTEESTCP